MRKYSFHGENKRAAAKEHSRRENYFNECAITKIHLSSGKAPKFSFLGNNSVNHEPITTLIAVAEKCIDKSTSCNLSKKMTLLQHSTLVLLNLEHHKLSPVRSPTPHFLPFSPFSYLTSNISPTMSQGIRPRPILKKKAEAIAPNTATMFRM